jgi:hypothetical protein
MAAIYAVYGTEELLLPSNCALKFAHVIRKRLLCKAPLLRTQVSWMDRDASAHLSGGHEPGSRTGHYRTWGD